MVDMRKCTVKALRQAQQSGGIPEGVILKATLDICDDLQERNEAASKLIQVKVDY